MCKNTWSFAKFWHIKQIKIKILQNFDDRIKKFNKLDAILLKYAKLSNFPLNINQANLVELHEIVWHIENYVILNKICEIRYNF